MIPRIFTIEYLGHRFKIAANYKPSGNSLIFCIHGLGCAKESFSGIFDFPQFNDFTILTPDLIGFGESSKPYDFSYSMEDQAMVCKLIIDKINPKNVHLVAHSMGGAVGLLLAEKIPERLSSFTNIEGNLVSQDCGIASRRAISVSFDKFKIRLFDEMKAEITRSKDRSSTLWSKWIEQSSDLAFYRSAVSLVEWSDSGDLLRKFKDLKTRKVYIYGDKNSTMALLDELGDIEKISIPGSGHFVMTDNPKGFYDALARFIGGQD